MRCAWLLVAAGCGRVAFDPLAGTTRDGATDAPGDTQNNGDAPQPSSCSTPNGFLICDGFEEAALGAQWTRYETLGTVSVDTSRAYRGAASLHAHITGATPADQPKAEIRSSQGLMMNVTGTIYTRVWAYFASPYPTTFGQFVAYADQVGDGIGFGARNTNIVANDFTDINFAESATQQLPLDQWVCLEYEIPSNEISSIWTYVDDVEIMDVRLLKSTTQPPADHIYVGLDWPGNNATLPAIDAWFDELVVSTTPLNCSL